MLNAFKDTIKDFSGFLRKPTDEQDKDQSKLKKTKKFFLLLLIDLAMMVLLSLFINSFGDINIENHQVLLLLESAPIWLVFFLAVIALPFIEELIFRFPLRFKRNYPILAFIFVFPKTKTSIYNIWHKGFGYIFYLSAITFALIHITNFELNTTIIYLLPILVLPQFILGLLLGYLRVRYNFTCAFLLHALHNAIFISLFLFSQNSSTVNQKLNINNDQYSLKIEEIKRSKTTTYGVYEDSVRFIGVDLKTIISTITKIDVDLIKSNREKFLSKKLNLIFKNNSSEVLNNDSLILEHLCEIYSFEAETKQRDQQVFNLFVKDSLQLFKHSAQEENENYNLTISKKDITFENASLNQVGKALSMNYDQRFEFESDWSERFNLKVPNRNFSKLKHTLNTEYGIYLEEMEKEIEYIFINFNSNIKD